MYELHHFVYVELHFSAPPRSGADELGAGWILISLCTPLRAAAVCTTCCACTDAVINAPREPRGATGTVTECACATPTKEDARCTKYITHIHTHTHT